MGANYDSSGRRNNGSGTALLLETARGLKDIPTNHNIYFVAYANGAEPVGKSISSGACVHAGTLSGALACEFPAVGGGHEQNVFPGGFRPRLFSFPSGISTGMKERATSAITIGIQLSEYLCIRNEVREGPASVPRE